MSDLISRSALINALKIDRACIYSHVFSHVDCDAEEELMIDLVQIINNQPTIEVRPVVHGEWRKTSTPDVFQCSHCKKAVKMDMLCDSEYLREFCPKCGADMRKGGD